jgi:hypothetical protein
MESKSYFHTMEYMKQIQCTKHKIEFQLPTTEEEFLSGNLHDQIEAIWEHSEKSPKCKFLEIQN